MSVETAVAVAKPVINLRLFTIRIITAVSLFAVLGKANVWLDTATNSILALGYRALLLLLPLTLLVLGRRSLSVTLLCAGLGLVLLALTSHQGMVMFAAAPRKNIVGVSSGDSRIKPATRLPMFMATRL